LIQFQNIFYYIATKQNDDSQKLNICHGIYDIENKKIHINEIDSPFDKNVEKNWSLFVHHNEIKCVYKWNPCMIGIITKKNTFEIKNVKHYHQLPFLKHVKGSSCGYYDESDQSIWFLAHVHTNTHLRQYYHFFIILEYATLKMKKISDLFTFEQSKIEYALGLIVEKDRILISYSVWDRNPKIGIYDKQKIKSICHEIPHAK
jgi:hypothetical protein